MQTLIKESVHFVVFNRGARILKCSLFLKTVKIYRSSLDGFDKFVQKMLISNDDE